MGGIIPFWREPLEGFEPSTCGLRNRRYATKPQRHYPIRWSPMGNKLDLSRNLHIPAVPYPLPMQRLTASERLPGGITVYWDQSGEEMEASFSFMELVDRRVNSLDLLEHPEKYVFDDGSGALILKP